MAHPLACGLRIMSPGRNLDTPEVLAIVEVPGGGMAHYLPPIRWLLQHRLVPELRGHRQKPQGGEEIIRFLKHPSGSPALQTEEALLKLGTVGADCVSQVGRALGEGQAGRKELAQRPPSSQGGASPPLCPGAPWRSRSDGEERCRPALSWPLWHPPWGLKGREPPSHRCWPSSVPTCSLEAGREETAETGEIGVTS